MPTILGDFLSAQDAHGTNFGIAEREKGHRIAGIFHLALKHFSRKAPLTLFIDDVQWGDSASLSVLHYIAHCDTSLPIFILLASRSKNLELFEENRWKLDISISLKGLSLSESRAMIRELRPALVAGDAVQDIHQITGGNPLLLRAYAANNQTIDSPLPPTVKNYFQREVARLHDYSQLLGAALYATGIPLPSSQLARLAGLDSDMANAGIRDLDFYGFININNDNGTVAFKHNSVGEAFLANLAPVASAQLHGRIARMWRDGGFPAAMVATQMTVAGNDIETYKYASEAARASLRLFAYREAEHFFRIAMITAQEPSLELDSRVTLSTILLRQGRSEEAEALLRGCNDTDRLDKRQRAILEAHLLIARLAEIAPPAVPEQALRRALTLQELLPAQTAARLFAAIAGNAQQGLHRLVKASINEASKSVDRITDRSEQLQLSVRFSAFRAINAIDAPDFVELDRLVAESSKWPACFAACLSDVASLRISKGDIRSAEWQLVQALRICEEYGFLDERLRVLNNLGVCYLEQGRWDEAEHQFKSVVCGSGSGTAKEVTSALSNILILDYERGEFARAVAIGNEYLTQRPLQTRLRIGSLGVLGLAYLELGRLSQARKCYNDIRSASTFDCGWSNDVSYLEIFRSRLAVIDGHPRLAERQLREKIADFASRDFFCTARMKLEAIRLLSMRSPKDALRAGNGLRHVLAGAHAIPLVDRLDDVIYQSRSRLQH